MTRPSASVLLISIVLPFIARTMSPGLAARPLSMFSTAATTPTTRTCGRSAGSAPIAAITAAPPAMSDFIHCRSAVLMLIPPLSKHTPLPTRATVFLARGGAYSSEMSRGGLALPPPTARIAPMPSASIAAGSNSMNFNPAVRATSCAISASRWGYSWLGGSLTRSRAKVVACAASRPRARPSSRCFT